MFKDIQEYEGLYKISSEGMVLKCGKSCNCGNGLWETVKITPRVIKHKPNEKGYHRVELTKEGKRHSFRVHRLVAQHFLPNPDNLEEVNHIDEDKDNNSVSNLEWCTHDYNIRHSIKTKKIPTKSVAQFTKNGEYIADYISVSEASRKTGVPTTHISRTANGSYGYKSAGGFVWRYIDGKS